MFTLETSVIPSSAKELVTAINTSLRKSIRLPGAATPVAIVGELPNLSSLIIDVSNGEIDPDQPLPGATSSADLSSGPSAETFSITGRPISFEGISLEFQLSATRVEFAYARNSQSNLVATVRSATQGQLLVQLGHRELEAGLLAIAQRFAASSGASILKVQATLTSISQTQLDVLLNITAKKFVSANVRITGQLSIDDNLVAKATQLQADGDGMVGNIAVGFLRPQLQKLNGKPLSLMAFSLGSVKLRGVHVRTDNGLQISAAFGSEAV